MTNFQEKARELLSSFEQYPFIGNVLKRHRDAEKLVSALAQAEKKGEKDGMMSILRLTYGMTLNCKNLCCVEATGELIEKFQEAICTKANEVK